MTIRSHWTLGLVVLGGVLLGLQSCYVTPQDAPTQSGPDGGGGNDGAPNRQAELDATLADAGSSDGGRSPACEWVADERLEQVFARYFEKSVPTGCTESGCHGTGAGGLSFKTAQDLWAATVNQPAKLAAGKILVVPGFPERSHFFQRLQATDPNPMPQGGPYLDKAALQAVAGWICAGARPPAPPAPGATDGGQDASGDGSCCTAAPSIGGFTPSSGVVGTLVDIQGAGFSAVLSDNQVRFNGVAATVTAASATTLTTSVPVGASSGPITVTVGGQTGTSASPFSVILPNPVPSLVGVTPLTFTAGSNDTSLVVTGTNFVGLSVVQWDDTNLTTTFQSSTSLTASVPAAKLTARGDHTLRVINPGPGGGSSLGQTMAILNPKPSITSLSVTEVLLGSAGETVTIAGSGFVAESAVSANGTPLVPTGVSGTAMTVNVPSTLLSVAGPIAFVVSNPPHGALGGGGSSTSASLLVKNPSPTLAQLVPQQVLAGTTAVTLDLKGTGFLPLTTVLVDDAPLAATAITSSSGSLIQVKVPDGLVQSGGNHTFRVTNPTPGGGSSTSQAWVVNNPLPALDASTPLTPAETVTNGAPFTLTVKGTGFVPSPGSVVTLDGTPVPTTFVSGTELKASIGTLTSAKTYAIAVTNPTPQGGTSGVASLKATDVTLPTVTGIQPNPVAAGATVTVSVTGALFSCSGPTASKVILDGISALTPASCTSATALDVVLTNLTAGFHTLAIRNGAPSVTVGPAYPFEAKTPHPTPVLGSLSPNPVAAGSATFPLTLAGDAFVQGAEVLLDGTPLVTAFVNSQTLTASVPSTAVASVGTPAIKVRNPAPGGGDSGALSLQVVTPNPKPAISGLTPSSVDEKTATTLTLVGGSFVSGAKVKIEGVERSAEFVSSTELRVAVTVSDTAVVGPKSVVVTNPGPGGGDSNAFSLVVNAVNPAPKVTALNPAKATAGGGSFQLLITGTGFVSSSTVTFNGHAVTKAFQSDTQVTADIPASEIAVAGVFGVVVTSPAPGGGASPGVDFTVENPVPELAATSPITPSSVASGGSSFPLTVNGKNFVSTSKVRWDGVERTTTFVNSTQLTATILAGDIAMTGTHTVTVFSPGPGGGLTASEPLTVTNPPSPAPSVSSLSPVGIVAGKGNFTLTVNGSNFVASTKATFQGTSVTTTVLSATQLTLDVPGSLVATAPSGNYGTILVTTPAPGGGSASAVLGVASSAVTMAAVQSIFTAKCAAACHDAATPSAGLILSDGSSYNALVGVNSTQCGTRKLVLKGDPRTTQSYLLAKVMGVDMCSGNTMPKPPKTVTAAEKQTLVDWVASGAPNP